MRQTAAGQICGSPSPTSGLWGSENEDGHTQNKEAMVCDMNQGWLDNKFPLTLVFPKKEESQSKSTK